MKDLQQELRNLFNLTHASQNMGKEQLCKLYKDLVIEECAEYITAKKDEDIYKEAMDTIWCLIQYCNAKGWDVEKGMSALIEEYKSKFYTKERKYQPLYREDGKLLKNTGFTKADFSKLLI